MDFQVINACSAAFTSVRACVRLDPFRVIALGLFRFASKTKIRQQSPVPIWADLIEQKRHDAPGHLCESILVSRCIRQHDAEENGRLSARVLSYVVVDPNGFSAELSNRLVHDIRELHLTDETAGNHSSSRRCKAAVVESCHQGS
jgi:hypothetical protein